MKTDPRNELLHGYIATQAALRGGQREVFRVWLDRDRDDNTTRRLTQACKQLGVRYTPAARDDIDQAAGGKSGHGGVLTEVGARRFVDADALFAPPTPTPQAPPPEVSESPASESTDAADQQAAAAPDVTRPAFVAMLDGIEDPFNFGQSVRALYAAGCTGLFVRPRNWTTAAAVVARASAGATERIDMAIVEGPEDAAQAAEKHGVMVVATGQADDAVPYTRVDFTGPTLLMIGGERRGLQRSFLAQCAQVVSIPYGDGVHFPAALGTVAACSILGFEIARQRAD